MSKKARIKRIENVGVRLNKCEKRIGSLEKKVDLIEGSLEYMNGITGKKAAEDRHMTSGQLTKYANSLGIVKIKR